MNLLSETLEEMTSHDQSPETVAWAGDRDGTFSGSWEDFAALANFEYDESWGSNEINGDLLVVFVDGSWLERHEYDGSEWWEYKATPIRGGAPLAYEDQLTTHAHSLYSGRDGR